MTAQRLHIDVLADFICPWCYIGKRKLDQALALPREFEISLIWRPYQLDPSIPEDGVDYKTSMRQKFGPDAGKVIAEKINQASDGTYLQFNFNQIERTPNTLRSHRLMIYAGQMGQQHKLAEALFAAYFEQGRDIGDPTVLAEIAQACGLEQDASEAAVASHQADDHIKASNMNARESGVSGVPALILGGQFMLMGAQEPEYLHRIFLKAHAKLATPEAQSGPNA